MIKVPSLPGNLLFMTLCGLNI